MLRSILVAVFPAAMLASGVIANAQSVAWNGTATSGSWNGPLIHQHSAQQQQSSPQKNTTKPASRFGSTQNAQHHATHHNRNRHHNINAPWWSRSVYINAGAASDYLATPTPKPKPKNKVTQPGTEVFKSIGN